MAQLPIFEMIHIQLIPNPYLIKTSSMKLSQSTHHHQPNIFLYGTKPVSTKTENPISEHHMSYLKNFLDETFPINSPSLRNILLLQKFGKTFTFPKKRRVNIKADESLMSIRVQSKTKTKILNTQPYLIPIPINPSVGTFP
jgi:hypothetical protein